MASAGPVEQAATLTGVLGVWLMIRQSLWAFPVGLVQVALSAVVFHEARFYADMKLQAVYFGVLAYGWWLWTRPSGGPEPLRVGRLSLRGWIWCLLGGLVGTALWGWYLAGHTDAAMPYRDAFISSFSVVAQWLQTRKKIENWYGWILVDAIAVPVYWLGGMHWLAVLYFLFQLMAVGGLLEWRRSALTALPSAAPQEDEAPESAGAPGR
jgi:nicotinamide mononucleotide transporter